MRLATKKSVITKLLTSAIGDTILNPVNAWLSIEWNLIILSGPAHGIVTKTVHTSLPGGGGGGVKGSLGDGGVG